MSSLFDGEPYTLQARNADTWLIEESGVIHIHDLCSQRGTESTDALPTSRHPPLHVPPALLTCLSPCGQLMARLAAHAGLIQDRIVALSANSSLSMQERFQHAESIADEINVAMLELGRRADTMHLTPSHSLLLSIGRARIQRDAAVQLSNSLHLRPEGASRWDLAAHIFYRRRLDMANSLISCAVLHAGRIPLHLLGEPFFTYFIHDPVIELATAIQRECEDDSQSFSLERIFDDLQGAIKGRNLLVIIAKQSELAVNHQLARKACSQLAEVVRKVTLNHSTTHSLCDYIADTRRVVHSLDQLAQLESSMHDKNTSTANELQEAADVLDWIAALPALQHIFELSST